MAAATFGRVRVIYGAWECSRCGQKGQLPTTPDGDWAKSDENAAFVKRHLEQCFTEQEIAEGVSSQDFFVGTLTIKGT